MAATTPDTDALPALHEASAIADWRRRTYALYAAVRAESDPAAAHAVWTTGRSELFEHHPASARSGGQRLQHAAYDPAFRLTVHPVAAEETTWTAQTGTDGSVPFQRVGRLELPDLGGLDVWRLTTYGNGLFVPLRDATAGSLTYGAGRYLLDTVKGADLGAADDGAWVVDLNFAYNPSCVYDERWACPLAPAGNRLTTAVPVGELLPES